MNLFKYILSVFVTLSLFSVHVISATEEKEDVISQASLSPQTQSIEQMWIRQWVFYSNSIRYSSAMTGAPDYTSFKNGWWYLNENLQHMKDWIEFKKEGKKKD